MLVPPKVVLLSSDEMESKLWQDLLREHVILKRVKNLPELESTLADGDYDALFCGWSFHTGTWSDVLRQVQQRCPDLPVVIFCRTGGEDEWVRVMEAGAFDLLVAPYQKRTVLPVLQHAIASYEGRRLHSLSSFPRARAS